MQEITRVRALCCECGNLRTVAANYSPPWDANRTGEGFPAMARPPLEWGMAAPARARLVPDEHLARAEPVTARATLGRTDHP
jgi:hypothetical protein